MIETGSIGRGRGGSKEREEGRRQEGEGGRGGNGNPRERPTFASLAARVAELTDATREVGDRGSMGRGRGREA